MLLTLLRGAVKYVTTLIAASILIFFALRIVPGNPAEVALGVTATPEAVAQLSASMGLDRPIVEQYFSWVGDMLRGDFGSSLLSSTDISTEVVDKLMVSLILVGLGMTTALCLAVPLGLWAARRVDKADGVFIAALGQIGIAIPSFLAAILLITVFSVHLGWFPANGWVVPSSDFSGFVSRLILPVFSLGIVQAAIMSRYVRSAALEVMNADFMRTARAQGLSMGQALRRHGVRNAALPVLTVTGVQLATLLVGAVVIEKVFVIPGLGSMLLSAVSNRDLPTVQTIVMLLVVIAVVINAIVDLLYVIIDPRIRREA
ncbi:Nickel transport system permease protein NikB [Corynebacterium diphtheriae subsp. lausannense]|uniref:ABC transporter permease n=1 Tax=Corynebacterium belfantii TaxID=2014537 RepID=UPI00095D95EF|nr:ABC transporter permease [Corynebacterium belfantii]OLN15280.1 ABC transporter permease [Corynebacterium diphtheriae subsp. lausannense]MBG9244588.1 ABC transporter permease [Corynebacterium belfantii]MBG9309206.1 ABC transporter permease [Corynebacterium belfantii]MBG9329063.1 ABC transporter permease [Corynebacterium belfantii]MBG9347528.1 ABC transporter permease [Corynebacterium belfantii]